jgi:hypothetical protein
MSIKINQSLSDLLKIEQTIKILATTDENGNPHAVVKQFIHVDEDGNLVCLELLESSRTNRNLVRSIWFGRDVAVTILGKGDVSYQVKGKLIKAHVAGPIFRKYYVKVRERLGDVDLAAVWIIAPEEVINETFTVRRAEEEAARPYFTHLDRLTGKEENHV